MPTPWRIVDTVETEEGLLELRQRGERGFLLLVDGRVLMSSEVTRSELAVARLACEPIRDRAARVLIGGLGLGYTLRAALDVLPSSATVEVAELNAAVVDWCRGPLAVLTEDAVSDPRVTVTVTDVMDRLAGASPAPATGGQPTARPSESTGPWIPPREDWPKEPELRGDRRRRQGEADERWDAIVVDLYLGPSSAEDPLYGEVALARIHAALKPGGVYAVWGEERHPPFERRLRHAGFRVETVTDHGGGPRHPVYLAIK